MGHKALTAGGFVLTQVVVAGNRRTVARFSCYKCDKTLDCGIGGRLAPELIANRARFQGWEADPWSASKVRCPDCASRRFSTTIEPTEEDATMPPTKLTLASPATPSNDAAPSAPEPTAAIVVVREPTRAERFAIRQMLDRHFDDQKGIYLDGQSDATVAEALTLPRLMVERVRETAYGPLAVVDPELTRMAAELAAMDNALRPLLEGVGAQIKAAQSARLKIESAMREVAALAARVNLKING